MDRKLLREIARLADDDGVLSVYITTDPRHEGTARPAWQVRMRNEIAGVLERVRAGGDERRLVAVRRRITELEPDLARMLEAARPGQGRALFAAIGRPVAYPVWLQVPLTDLVALAPLAYLHPLVAAWNTSAPAGIAAVSAAGIRVIDWRFGLAREVSDLPCALGTGDWRELTGPAAANPVHAQHSVSQRDLYTRRVAEHLTRFLRGTGPALASLTVPGDDVRARPTVPPAPDATGVPPLNPRSATTHPFGSRPMCRLFGLSAVPHRVTATFWLIDAPDSLAVQSRREPDGVGLGVFEPDGTAVVHKRPIAAYQDAVFAREAREVSSGTFLAHVRYASTGGVRSENTHPFRQDGRLFAHNGVVTGLGRLRDKIGEEVGGPICELVGGDTDSEQVFALITAYARRDGDLGRAIVDAVGWIAANLPVYALNLIVTTPTDLWALRYPGTHPLYVLPRPAGGHHGGRHLEHASAPGTVRVRSGDLAAAPATVVASERMDEDPHWRLLAPGELLHVAAGQHVTSRTAFDGPPARSLTLADLHPRAAASQHAHPGRA